MLTVAVTPPPVLPLELLDELEDELLEDELFEEELLEDELELEEELDELEELLEELELELLPPLTLPKPIEPLQCSHSE